DGTYLKLYVNGVFSSQTAAAAPADTTGIPVKMGLHYSNPATYGYISGTIDDARIYGRALSDTEITALAAGSGGGSAPPVAHTGSGTATVVVTNSAVPVPTPPTGLTANAPNCTNVSLSWNASTDVGGPGLAGYKVYRNGSFLQQVSSTSAADNAVAASSSYS